MAKPEIIVGLEIGTTKTCMAVGEVNRDGSMRVLAIGEVKTVGVNKGCIVNFDQARICVRDALHEAEESFNGNISKLYLSVTGEHIHSINHRGSYRLMDGADYVEFEHLKTVKENAEDVNIPSDHVFISSLECGYWLDGTPSATPPVGLAGSILECEYHIIHSQRTKLMNSLKCVQQNPLQVEGLVFAPIASAQIVLSQVHKQNGSLVIDLGGGTTDYVLYLNGVIEASGTIPLGGGHVTNDIHVVTDLPMSVSEILKVEEADVSGDEAAMVGSIDLSDDNGFEYQVQRELLNQVVAGRMQEILELVRDQLPVGAMEKVNSGIFLTGGTSQMSGLDVLAQDVFGLHVNKQERVEFVEKKPEHEEPQYSTVIGMIRYAQVHIEKSKSESNGFFAWLRRLLPF